MLQSPELLREPEAYQRRCEQARAEGRTVGLVPTMGALHQGHLALVQEARRQGADFLVVTIFVNPLQFGEGEDFDRYPRTLERDLEQCARQGVHLVFAPTTQAMYPEGFQSRVQVTELSRRWEGEHRPGHFEGVATIVTKLFALTGRCIAVFGRKDYQQWRLVQRLVRDLNLPVRLVDRPTVRDTDGLATSSRNRYLGEAERRRALALAWGLRQAALAYERGERDAETLRTLVLDPVRRAFDSVDYVAIAHPETLEPLEGRIEERGAVLLAAARIGSTRLIDNLWLGVDAVPSVSLPCDREGRPLQGA